jgi:hypothetical protein
LQDNHLSTFAVTCCAGFYEILASYIQYGVPLMVVVPQLQAALRLHPDSADVAAKCAGCLGHLSRFADYSFPVTAVVSQLQAALERHPDSSELVAKCSWFTSSLAR